MAFWPIVGWSSVCLGCMAALYGLHRLGLRLEEQGYIYYWYKKPSGSAAGCFVALQRAVEPQVQHVQQARAEQNRDGDDESAGRGRVQVAEEGQEPMN